MNWLNTLIAWVVLVPLLVAWGGTRWYESDRRRYEEWRDKNGRVE